MSHGRWQNSPIEVSASGDNTIVAGVAGKHIHVLQVVIIAAAEVTVRWKSGATNLSGPMALAKNGGYSAESSSEYPRPIEGVLVTGQGEALVLNLGAAVSVGGHLRYFVK